MMDWNSIFKIYINLPFYGPMHFWSLFVLVAAFIIPIVMLSRIHIIYRVMFSVSMGLFSKSILEMEYTIGMGKSPNLYDLICLFGAIAVLLVYNGKLWRLRFDKRIMILGLLQVVVLVLMWNSGFFEALRIFLANGPDPHNWLWAISKTNGMLMWLSLIDTKRKGEEVK